MFGDEAHLAQCPLKAAASMFDCIDAGVDQPSPLDEVGALVAADPESRGRQAEEKGERGREVEEPSSHAAMLPRRERDCGR